MPTNRNALLIRTMTLADLDLALDLAAAEGWNPGLQDAIPFSAADPEGFLLGELAGEPIGTISAVRYGQDFGFIGCFIVRPQWRGQGYGRQLWQAALNRLAGRNLGLDGVLAQVENYQRSGFQTVYQHQRYSGIGQPGHLISPIQALSALPFTALCRYDRQHFGYNRTPFLQAWLQTYGGYGWFQADRLQGYGVIRPCRQGFKIGPLFADTPEIAGALFQALSTQAAHQPIFLDIPDANPAALDLVQTQQMEPVFTCARMYTQSPPAISIEQVFGVTSLELG
jgi:GNAT superfamily N-acetyltransferase